MFTIIDEAINALNILTRNGYEAYLVGGCIRDQYLGKEVNDYDITTNALPQEITTVFSEFKVINTGIKHGTVTVIINKTPIEITTYRVDGEYSDNRHPDKVNFSSSIYDDLSRRDFTINSIAYNGSVLDLFGGISDIENKIIRCIGDPDQRFNEDGLRILRALRFASVFGFKLEKNTCEAVFNNKHLLKNISKERIYSELSKLLCGSNADQIVSEYGSVFDEIFIGKDFYGSANNLNNVSPELSLRFSLFFLNDKYYEDDMKSLKPDNATFKRVCNCIKKYNTEFFDDKVNVKMFLRDFNEQIFKDVCNLKQATGQDVSKLYSIYRSIIDNNECYKIEHLNISGNDILQLGFKNKQVGNILNNVLESVIKEKLKNNRDDIFLYVKSKYNCVQGG